ncbi:uncharacterized protein BO95DRAFT_174255 [Aspergillus brunneoviolaceus CBS 621.78]|uniref:Uncharacterized protein n=1 Tax=Aspergillus brunneoviolaceus CBS 621.78 TaxID=1450534 RepID=A0ACD1G5G1_9EURO|nr:hypothetical protein BO95DRAFT_174255 [Aspergillus brunneoviolaceus CBS 621.78]RAH44505.1 hypothetical protein BO95DRAFT_174255 [Aspergillus brunneoviolaceus CBS 621.78]
MTPTCADGPASVDTVLILPVHAQCSSYPDNSCSAAQKSTIELEMTNTISLASFAASDFQSSPYYEAFFPASVRSSTFTADAANVLARSFKKPCSQMADRISCKSPAITKACASYQGRNGTPEHHEQGGQRRLPALCHRDILVSSTTRLPPAIIFLSTFCGVSTMAPGTHASCT